MRSLLPALLLATLFLAALPCPAAETEAVRDGPRALLSLDGEWDVLPNEGLTFRYPPKSDGWTKESVPQASSKAISTLGGPYIPGVAELLNKEGTGFKQTEKIAAWYRRGFRVAAADLAGKRAALVFQGAAYRSTVWVNGKEMGTAFQCAVPFEHDVTAVLKPGENEVLVGLTGREGIFDLQSKCFVTPCNGMMAGLWGSVELQLRPTAYIDDVFIRTSVQKKRIEVEVTVRNAGANPQALRPSVLVTDASGAAQCAFEGAPATVAPGKTQTVTLARDWLAPKLWTPETPALYFARVSLLQGEAAVDRTTTRFGFREFEIRGRDFYLNGVRTVLFRTSNLAALGAEFGNSYRSVRADAGRPFNSIRLHLGQNNVSHLDACDQFGVMAVPEASWSWVNRYPSERKSVWLENTKEYFRRWIRQHRNRPSVVMWSLCNETYWDNRRPEDLAIADEILAVAKEMDPTRPQQGDGETSWDGRLPTINIHYPEGEAGDVRREFPNSGLVVPNDLWWLKEEGLNEGWRAKFEWDRPLVLGEYWWITGSPDARSSYLGDAVYDWETWRFADSRERISETEDTAALQKATDYYRRAGVAALNPWSGNRQLFMRLVDVRPIDYHPSFFAGETTVRKTVVLNDTQTDHYDMHLQCRLVVAGRTVWQETIKCGVPPGTHRDYDVPVACPAVAALTPATLIVRLRYWRAGGYHELSRFEDAITIVPRASLAGVDPSGVVLLDETGRTQQVLEKMGFRTAAVKVLTTESLAKARLVIVGEETDCAPSAEALRSFVAEGGAALLLRQTEWRTPAAELPEADPQHAASMAWVRSPEHPVMAGLSDAQMRWWRPDHLISKRTLHKPTTGRFQVLLDCGGRYGMQWTPLTEVRAGKGLYLACQLPLAERVAVEPMAGEMLARLVRYALAPTPAVAQPLRLLAGTNDALRKTLAACSVVVKEGLEGDGPVLVDGSQEVSAADLEALRAHLAQGGSVWLHRFTPETLKKVAALFPFPPALAEFDPTIQAGALRSDGKLTAGLGSFDLFWTRVDTGSRADIFQDGQPTAKLGQYAIQLPSLAAGEALMTPALLARVPAGKGTILFDNLWWEDAFGAESGRVSRLVSSLVTRLGGDVKLEAEPEYAYFQVDLAPHVNMGYYDRVEGDGEGGWTDQGRNDMRFFLVNHTGRAGGQDDAPEVGTEAWPEVARFAGKPFRLVDPTKGARKGVVTLRGGDHCPFLPGEVKGIQVGRKADRLWFLHTACWAIDDKVHAELGRYVVRYEGGATATVPLRYGLELQDWWNPGPLPNSRVGWTGQNLMHSPIGVWVTAWENPNPDRRIESIDLVGNLSGTQIVLLGITGGTMAGGAAERVVSRWSLADAAEGAVPNKVAGGPALRFGKTAPEAFSGDGHAGLRFGGGRSLVGDGRGVPAFGAQAPFSLEVTAAVEKPPVGYLGGLFQCMEYRKSGFRLVYYQDMRLGVEIYPGEEKAAHIKGRTALQPGRFTRIRVQFEAGRAQLYLDGKVDGSVDTPPPAPCPAEIQVGTASGKDYHLEGAIEGITIRVPASP